MRKKYRKLGISGISNLRGDERRVTPALWGNDSVDLLRKLQLQGRTESQQCLQWVCVMAVDTTKLNADQSRACLKGPQENVTA